ncbi:MAG TPA: hypothetical protein V6D11_30375 [Waterburya sp.]|jgi:hypothetical protein
MNLPKLILKLTVVIAAVAIAATPLTASAQSRPSSSPSQSQQQRNRVPRIVFSQDQQAKFEKLQMETIGKINAALTKEQQQQFAAGVQSGQGFKNVKNLSDDQKRQIQGILEDFNVAIGNILTTEQKEQIRQFQESQRSQPNQQ